MIKIEANRRGNSMDLRIEVDGEAVDLGIEAAHILAQLPSDLQENAGEAFEVMRIAFPKIAEKLTTERLTKEHFKEEDNDGHKH